MKIQLITSSEDSWIIPYGKKLMDDLQSKGHDCSYLINDDKVEKGDVLVFLSYEKIFADLSLNKHNLVIHESDLPKGRGMSPLTWQVLEGINDIPVTLLEASEKVDAGKIYNQLWIHLEGHELIAEIKQKQGEATIELVTWFVDNYPASASGKEQSGEPTYYKRRNRQHSRLDVNKTILEQFNLLRVCDNQRYPAFFELGGHTYTIKIEKNN
ncbi:MAG: hypothetical protein JO301_10070 [Chitinophagaceae bacterium]|nr:hypothetical protein [Chitinophagaceae bacterium]